MSEEKISLLNCNYSQKRIKLTSPNSLLAIHLIGVTLDDLRYLTFDEYIKNNPDIQYLERDLQEERYNHHERNRLELIEQAKKIREELLEEKSYQTTPQNNLSSFALSPKAQNRNMRYNFNTMKKNTSALTIKPAIKLQKSTAILLEREKLQKLIEKQENKVKLQIDYECMIEENRRKNLEKMRNKELKEERKRKEKEREMAEKREKEREKMLEKKRKEEELMKEQEKFRKEEEIKEKKKLEEEKVRKEEEEKERKNKIFERELKEEEFRQKINKMNLQQRERLLEKEKELNEKDLKRQKNLEEHRKESYRIMAEKRIFLQNKMNKALNRSESKLNQKKNEYLEKQKKFENLKKIKEKEKLFKLRVQNEEIARRSEKIKHVLEQYDENNKLKIQRYNQKMEEISKRKEEKKKKEMKELEEEKRKKEEREKRLNELRNKFEKNMAENRQRLMNKIITTDEKIKNHRKEQEKQLHIKYNKLYMSREDRKNRVLRKERVKDFERSQKMEEINARMQRIDDMKKDRYLLEEERRKMENELNFKKTNMLKRLQNIIKSDKHMNKNEIMDYVFDAKHASKTITYENNNHNDSNMSNKDSSPNKEK